MYFLLTRAGVWGKQLSHGERQEIGAECCASEPAPKIAVRNIGLKIPSVWVDEIDRLAEVFSKRAGYPCTRSDAFRMLLRRGIDAFVLDEQQVVPRRRTLAKSPKRS
jgi:hypothetical protein